MTTTVFTQIGYESGEPWWSRRWWWSVVPIAEDSPDAQIAMAYQVPLAMLTTYTDAAYGRARTRRGAESRAARHVQTLKGNR